MSFWQFEQAVEGYVDAHTVESADDKSKLSDEEADELWAWMEERQKANPVPALPPGHRALNATTDAALPL